MDLDLLSRKTISWKGRNFLAAIYCLHLPEEKAASLALNATAPAEVLLNEFSSEPNPLETWFRARYAKSDSGLWI